MPGAVRCYRNSARSAFRTGRPLPVLEPKAQVSARRRPVTSNPEPRVPPDTVALAHEHLQDHTGGEVALERRKAHSPPAHHLARAAPGTASAATADGDPRTDRRAYRQQPDTDAGFREGAPQPNYRSGTKKWGTEAPRHGVLRPRPNLQSPPTDSGRSVLVRHPQTDHRRSHREGPRGYGSERIVEAPVPIQIPGLLVQTTVGIAPVRDEPHGLARDRVVWERSKAGVGPLVGREGGRSCGAGNQRDAGGRYRSNPLAAKKGSAEREKRRYAARYSDVSVEGAAHSSPR
jgi:hypothetical protein